MELLFISLRLIVPIFVVRFPISTILASLWLDFNDFTYIGHFEHYQIIDKWLDLYYLAWCLYASRRWLDTRAKRIALYLFVYRFIGCALLTITNREEVLLIFPNVFEMFFIFFILYRRLSNCDYLLHSWRQTILIVSSLLLPKLVQEYGLHVKPLHPELTPDWFQSILNLPALVESILWISAPIAVLTYYVIRSRSSPTINDPEDTP